LKRLRFRDFKFAAGLMPSGAIEHDDGVASCGDVAADFGEVQVHRVSVNMGQDERCPEVAAGADGTE
jgi:hypothetical protein